MLSNILADYNKRTRIILLVLQLIAISYFISYVSSETMIGPTLDDAWVYYQFAHNFAEYREISFNQGEWSNCTSLSWILLLSSGIILGIPLLQFSIAIGVILYILFGQLVYSLYLSYWKDKFNHIIAVLIVVFTGNILWYSLSGMETMLFLVLGLFWILSFDKEKYIIAGILAGALAITRTEGLVFLLMGIFFVFRRLGFKAGVKPALLQLALCAAFIIPTMSMYYITTGDPFPHTLKGKQFLYGMNVGALNLSITGTINYIKAWASTFFAGNWFPELMDHPNTIQISLLRILSLGKFKRRELEFDIEPNPVWEQTLALIIGIILFVILIRGIIITIRRLTSDFFKERRLKQWEYLALWIIGLNLIYLALMPIRGHGGRYQAVNFIIVGILLITGADWRSLKYPWITKLSRYIIKPGILLVYFLALFSWADVYSKSVLHVNQVHRAAGEWIDKELPKDAVVAIFDGGAIKYFSQRYLVDVAGIFEGEGLQRMLEGDGARFLKEKNTQYFAMIEDETQKRRFISNGYQPFDSKFYDQLNLRKDIGVTMNLKEIKRFELPLENWWRHWEIVITHSPTIVIYKIEWLI